MRRTALMITVASALVVASSPADAQLAIGARAGTTGVGGEVSFGIIPKLALRGTATVIPYKPKFSADDGSTAIEYEAELPSPLFTAGADFYLTSALRIFGGVLIGADELNADGTYTGTVTFGGRQYTGNGTVAALVKTSSTAPFAGIGFGSTIGRGIGINLDIGGALLGESTVTVDATGPIASSPDYQQRRGEEQAKIQDKVDKYAKIYPMISLGIRVGLGN